MTMRVGQKSAAAGLDDLIARLEKATGPDRNLDCEIWVVANGKGQPMKIVGQPYYETPRFFCNPNPEVNWIGYDLLNNAPLYTASLDAAMSLVPKGLNGSIAFGKFFGAILWGSDPRKHQGENRAPTAALALCIASLKYRKAIALAERGA